jgi:chaperone required for assembly of F1-ATPase
MRDLFEEFFDNNPLDPTEAARRAVRPRLMRRFYANVGVAPEPGGVSVRLDDRPIKTPARRSLVAPTQPLAAAIAAEWDAQSEVIDPAKMPLTRLANSIIDGVAGESAAVAAEIAKYLGSDLLYYRAETPRGLIARQAEMWDPILAFARDQLGARFVLTEGVTFVAQPEHAIAAARGAIPDDPWRVGAVHAITTLTGSALIALAVAEGVLTVDAAWAAAHVDEDWNMAQWGRDRLALERRAARFAEMQAAATVLELSKLES